MNILEYRNDLVDCPNGFLVTGTTDPVKDKKNRRLLARAQTGHWKMAEGRVKVGDAMFLLLPSKVGRGGYPRQLYGGRITSVVRAKGEAYIFSVDRFHRFPDVEKDIRGFLGGRLPPTGNVILSVWQGHVSLEATLADFETQVAAARNRTREERAARLKNAPRIPPRVRVTVEIFVRNPDVVAAVLDAAAGECAMCHRQGPFLRANNDRPYLEVHHRLPLAYGGEDTEKNAEALCPNCHREKHYGGSLAAERKSWEASKPQLRGRRAV